MGLSAGIIPISMKFLVVLSFAACTFAAPTADADAEAQYLAYGHGLVGGVYAAAPVVPEVKTVEVKAVPVVSYAAPAVAAPAVAAVKSVEVKAAPVAAVAYAAPAVHVATAPVVHHVGYQVHHQVHHIPKVTVQKHTSTHTTHH